MADEIVHNFPTAHTDYLTQYIGYQGARCDHEAYDTLIRKLAHDIATGKRTSGGRAAVEEAARDPDEAMIAGSMARQTVEKVKDVVTGREGADASR